MKKIYLLVLLMEICTSINAQQDSSYFINNGKLMYRDSVLLIIPENICKSESNGAKLTVGKKFVIIRLRDEMENNRGVIIFDKKKGVINFDPVQAERKKHYQPYSCCIYVQELNGLLYFWDYINSNGDYDCYYDSQTDEWISSIPRYYIFDTESGNIETKTLLNKCKVLIEDKKIICK